MTITVPKQKKVNYYLLGNGFLTCIYEFLSPNKTEYKLMIMGVLTLKPIKF
jgi:hypothetical protein